MMIHGVDEGARPQDSFAYNSMRERQCQANVPKKEDHAGLL
jgi:hypothetical protein